jgi:hypothetical protein
MRKTLFIAFAAFLSSTMGRAEDNTADVQKAGTDGIACFVNLMTPEYPKAALAAHVDGSIWTWTEVGADGRPGKIETRVVSAWSQAEQMLKAPVEKAIHASMVKPECMDRKVWVVFRYELHGDPVANPKVASRVDNPNIMWIESEPAISHATSASKIPTGR